MSLLPHFILCTSYLVMLLIMLKKIGKINRQTLDSFSKITMDFSREVMNSHIKEMAKLSMRVTILEHKSN